MMRQEISGKEEYRMYEKLPEELKKDGWFCLWK